MLLASTLHLGNAHEQYGASKFTRKFCMPLALYQSLSEAPSRLYLRVSMPGLNDLLSVRHKTGPRHLSAS
jgi:hypothetical protein